MVQIAREAREMVCEAENPPPHADGPDCSNFEIVYYKARRHGALK